MRDYSKFYTPFDVAMTMVNILAPTKGSRVLEPSAGLGVICAALRHYDMTLDITAVEINPKCIPSLLIVTDYTVNCDFLTVGLPDNAFDCCIANPPFGNGVSIRAHFTEMCRVTKEGGKIVLIAPTAWVPDALHEFHKLDNWATNSDGTTTSIGIFECINTKP